jgi:hypothetical protein
MQEFTRRPKRRQREGRGDEVEVVVCLETGSVRSGTYMERTLKVNGVAMNRVVTAISNLLRRV